MNQPQIIFLDEPTGSLDTTAGEIILQLLVKLNEKGQSIVMVTHDMEAAARGSRVIQIRNGFLQNTLELGKYEEKRLKERKVKIFSMLEEKNEK